MHKTVTLKNILITGKPGTGKTTLIKRILERLDNAGGFFTEEIRESGQRKGFKLVTLEGDESVLAHINISSRRRVGKYGVDLVSFEEIGVSSVERAIQENDYIVIDEIGKMELFSDRFKEAVIKALDSSKTVIAAVPSYSIPFVDRIKNREDVKIFRIDLKNRDRTAEEVVAFISME